LKIFTKPVILGHWEKGAGAPENANIFSEQTSAGCRKGLIGKAMRGHWPIENQLRRMLDVIFRGDASRARKDNSPLEPQRVARVARVAQNFALRFEAFDRRPLKCPQENAQSRPRSRLPCSPPPKIHLTIGEILAIIDKVNATFGRRLYNARQYARRP
jgi:hypothetical protein